jgi:hypothetical protein
MYREGSGYQSEDKAYEDNTYGCIMAVLKENREMLEQYLYVDEAILLMVKIAETNSIYLKDVTFVFKD